jgi:hypothetical protein
MSSTTSMTKEQAAKIIGTTADHVAEVSENETRDESFSGVRDPNANHSYTVWLKNGIGYIVKDGKTVKRL